MRLSGTAGLRNGRICGRARSDRLQSGCSARTGCCGLSILSNSRFNPAIIFSLHRRKIRCRTIVSKIVNKSYSVRHPETIMTFSAFPSKSGISRSCAKSPQIRFSRKPAKQFQRHIFQPVKRQSFAVQTGFSQMVTGHTERSRRNNQIEFLHI